MMIDAALVHLSCELQAGKRTEILQLVLNESERNATVSYPKYRVAGKYSALFSPTHVTISYQFGSIVVDRTSLVIVQTTKLPIGKARVETGECKLTPVPADRKF